MNKVIKAVEEAVDPAAVLAHDCFAIDSEGFTRTVVGAVYGRRFTRYLLLKLDYFYNVHAHRMGFETLGRAYPAPAIQNSSQWKLDFSAEQNYSMTSHDWGISC